MENDLRTLAYISQSSVDETDSKLSMTVREILAVSRRNNEQVGVTGALLLSRGWFAQILEGTADAVETIFEAVQCDARHRNVRVLYYKPLETRNFAQWSMAFSEVSDRDSQTIAIDGLADADQIGQELVKILSDLISRKDGVLEPVSHSIGEGSR